MTSKSTSRSTSKTTSKSTSKTTSWTTSYTTDLTTSHATSQETSYTTDLTTDLTTSRETSYTIVGAVEADPLGGKISDVSPVGKALMNQSVGREISVTTPRGTIKYLIKRVTS